MDADSPRTILIVDDDQGLLRLIERTLQRGGFATATATSGKDAIEWLTRNTANLMLLDLKLQDIEGKELINHLVSIGRSAPFIIITGQGDARVAVDMMKRGALDYLVKDADFLQFVPGVVQRALDHLANEKRLVKAEDQALLGHTVLEQAYSAVLITTVDQPDPSVVYINPAFTQLTGCAAGEVTGQPLSLLEKLTNPMPELRRALSDAQPFSGERLVRTSHGGERLVDCHIAPVFDRDGRRTHGVAIQRDITERKRAEEALRRSQALLADAQRIAHLGSYQISVAGTGDDHWSEETFRILGLDPTTKELSPSDYSARIVHPEDRARLREAFEKSINECVRFDLQYRIVRPDGSTRHVHSIAEPKLGADGKASKLVGTLQDITERKELEKEILEISEREQSRIGQDLHDGLCQHLAGIEFRLLDLKQKLEAKADQQAAETSTVAKLVREGIEQTRTLARGLSPVMLEPSGLMNALQELAMSTESGFHISCSFSRPAPVMIFDNAVATHLYRIAQEAVHNAIRHGKAKFIVITLFTQSDRIVLGVKDDGLGLPENLDKHSGMGLRVMQYRAGMVGGTLVVQREPEGGTSVICSLRTERGGRKPSERGVRADPSTGESSAAAIAPRKPRPRSRPRRGDVRKDVAPSD